MWTEKIDDVGMVSTVSPFSVSLTFKRFRPTQKLGGVLWLWAVATLSHPAVYTSAAFYLLKCDAVVHWSL